MFLFYRYKWGRGSTPLKSVFRSKPAEPVRQSLETGFIGEDAFVVDDAPLFVSLNGGQGLGVLVSLDEMRAEYAEGPRFGERLSKFSEQGVFHGLKMKLLLPAHVQGEPANFHFRFAQACSVGIVFWDRRIRIPR